jgi:hypothetical protein
MARVTLASDPACAPSRVSLRDITCSCGKGLDSAAVFKSGSLVISIASHLGRAPFLRSLSHGPLLQKWFSYTAHPSARDPYFLYSASNLGSLIGLLGYPLLIEAYLSLPLQARSWSVSYILLAGMISACAIIALISSRIGMRSLNSETTDASPGLKVKQRIR